LGTEGANNLTWGGTAATAADHKQATYFGMSSTGRLAVTTSTCSTANQTAAFASTANNGDANGKICSGTNAVFNLEGTPNATISYTLNGIPNTVILNGSGVATVTINGATAQQVLALVKVTSATTFCETSLTATSTINIKTVPVITTQPVAASITYGADASFSVVANNGGDIGSTPTYQWQVKVGSASFANISGETASTLTLTKPTVAMSGNLYKCIVTNSCGSFGSDEVALTVGKANSTITVTPYTVK
jgi:hypothetical protein